MRSWLASGFSFTSRRKSAVLFATEDTTESPELNFGERMVEVSPKTVNLPINRR
jgi:hypothetical protein